MAVAQAFCSVCGGATAEQMPEGDNRLRDVCAVCGHIHYINPKLITGALPVKGDKVLLCKRNIEPRKGLWTLPAGFMEMAETTAEGAARETVEESEAELTDKTFYALIDLPHISQVYVFYRATLVGDHFAPTPESTEVKLFAEEEIPWEELAFPVVKTVLKTFFRERVEGQFGQHHFVLQKGQWLP